MKPWNVQSHRTQVAITILLVCQILLVLILLATALAFFPVWRECREMGHSVLYCLYIMG